jgi:hypothetical protein
MRLPGYGQVTSISNGVFAGSTGLAMSMPVAVPSIQEPTLLRLLSFLLCDPSRRQCKAPAIESLG